MNWLEHRVPPPLVTLVIAIAMAASTWLWPGWHMPFAVRLGGGLLVAVVGLAFTLPAVASFRRSKTTVNPIHIERASQLVTSGNYRFTRNPMYLGMALLLTAIAFGLGAPWTLLGPLALVAYLTRFQILPEERALRGIFGQPYLDYCKQVRRWI